MIMRHAVLVVLLATSVLCQAVIPETPAGTVLSTWSAAFNSADPSRIRVFDETHRREPRPLDQTLRFREMTGGFTILRIERSEPLSIFALLQERNSDTVARFELSVDSENPPKIVSDRLLVVARPPEFALPRMTEADALAALSTRVADLATNDQFSGAVLVARHGKVLLQRAWDRAGRDADSPVTVNTQFRIGSM